MKEINLSELSFNPMTMIGDEWLALTAGTKDGGFNSMTCSWGHMGNIWNKPSIVVYVRPQRYTKAFVDREDLYTLCFFDGRKKELGYLGARSGRDEDKVAAIVSNMTSKEAKKLMNQFFNKGKIDLRGYDANILDVDAYDSFINECPDEEDFCEADIEDADFELKNL